MPKLKPFSNKLQSENPSKFTDGNWVNLATAAAVVATAAAAAAATAVARSLNGRRPLPDGPRAPGASYCVAVS